jgi:hypothetical protein
VWVDPTNPELVDRVRSLRHGSIEQVVRDEINSNLASLSYVRRLSTEVEEKRAMTVKFFPSEKGNPPGKLSDAELHFGSGPLDGFKLIGFAVWERRSGGKNVTFPARQYSVNGERRSFALLRPISDTSVQDRIRDLILEAHRKFEDESRSDR